MTLAVHLSDAGIPVSLVDRGSRPVPYAMLPFRTTYF